MKSKIAVLLTLVMVIAMVASPAFALPLSAPTAAPAQSSPAAPLAQSAPVFQAAGAVGPAPYFVILSDPSVPSYIGGISGFRATNPAATGQSSLDLNSPEVQAYASHLEAQQTALIADVAQALGRAPEVSYQIQYALNAVVMVLSPAEAAVVAKLPGVAQVERETIEQVDTDYGPTWIGANTIWNGASTGSLPGTKGEGVIIGVLDTGINMDHPSFADIGGDGFNHTNPFGSGNYKGLCASNPGQWVCNDKLVGYWIYTGETADDEDGHGSHTASTAGGNYLAAGTVSLGAYPYSPAISGVAPHANIIGYDVCTPSGCSSTAMVNAMNQAILDGVHVINVSISISGNTWTGAQQQGYLSVFNAGITPVRSAGNSGPGANTIGPHPPWAVAVGASTHNRAGNNSLINMSGGSGAPANMSGKGFSGGAGPASIVYAGNAPYSNALCQTPAAPGTFTGKIVVCDRGTNARVAKGWNVLQGGAVGMVLANDSASGASLNGDVHHLPAVQITFSDGVTLKSWLSSGSGHTGTIAGTTISTAASNGDIMAGFSSRGPHPVTTLLTPDVTNPGVDILAAYRSGSTSPEVPTVEYAVVSGTSMSSPHTAGSAALLKALHPTWSPAEIKSALMDTGKFTGIRKEDGVTPAIPFDMGTGRVDLTQAGNASLIMNETGANFAAANPSSGGNPKTLNLASLADPACATACTWTRTVKATRAGAWNATYVTPTGMTLAATPSSFTLTAGQTQALNITANVSGLPVNQYAFGYVVLTKSSSNDPGDVIHLTVVVQPIPGQANTNVTPASLTATQATNTTTSQNLTIGNTGTSPLTWTIAEEPATIVQSAAGGQAPLPAAAGATGGRGSAVDGGSAPLAYVSTASFSEGFDDITTLPGAGWSFQNNSSPLGSTGWFPGNDTVFPAHAGAPTAYIGANFNNTSGAGAISNWMLTPEISLANGDTISFWTRTATGSIWADRLQVRLSTAGSSTNVGSSATDVGDFTTLLLDINPTLVAAGYPQVWTQYTATLSGIPGGATGRVAFRYFVTNGGPSGANSNYIGIDTLEYVSSSGSQTCDAPSNVPWLSVSPTSGTTAPAATTAVTVGFNSASLANGAYNANLCVTSNDPDAGPGNGTELVIVPVTLIVGDPTAVTLDGLSAAQAPLPAAGLPLAALPAAIGLALGAAYALRRKE